MSSETPTNDEDRLLALETLAAEQESTIQDLSDMVADQWQEIDRLKTKLGHLTDRLKRAEDRLPASPEDDDKPPPHY